VWDNDMESSNRSGGTLVLLVGANPLPNYLAALTLKPQRVVLLFSRQTRDPKDRLKKALEAQRLEAQRIEIVAGDWIVDATNAPSVRNKVSDILKEYEDARLNYTGGTKVMATHARIGFKEAKFSDQRASYIDGSDGVIRFDDGSSRPIPLRTDQLNLETLVALHGGRDPKPWMAVQGGPTEDDAHAIARVVLPPSPEPFDRVAFGRRLNANLVGVPADQWPKVWKDFLAGTWLEVWTAAQVRRVLPKAQVFSGVELTRETRTTRTFEVDVVAIHDTRVHVISCTTSCKVKRCKGKAFEAAVRARQLGGDLARCAIACFLDGLDEQDNVKVEQVQADVDALWDAPNALRVFGLAHLREWLDQGYDDLAHYLREEGADADSGRR